MALRGLRGQIPGTPSSVIPVQGRASGAVTVRIQNPTPTPFDVHRIPEQGDETALLGRIDPGFYIDMPAEFGQVLGFLDGRNFFGAYYVVTDEAQQLVTLPVAEGEPSGDASVVHSGEQAMVRIRNATAGPIQVHEIHVDADTHPVIGWIDPGGTLEVPADPGDLIGFRDGENWIGDTYDVTNAIDQSVTVSVAAGSGNATTPPAAGRAAGADVRFENPTDKRLGVHVLAADGSAAPMAAQIEPDFAIDLPLEAGQIVGFSDDAGSVGEPYNVIAAAGQVVTLPLTVPDAPVVQLPASEAPAGAAPVTVRIENPTGQSLAIHAISADRASAPLVAEVDAGFAIEIPLPPGQLVGFADGNGWVGSQYVVTGAAAQTVTLPVAEAAASLPPPPSDASPSGLATAEGAAPVEPASQTVAVRIENPTDQALQIHVISPDRSAAPLVATVDAGFAIELPLPAGQLVGFSDGNGWVGDAYAVSADAAQTVTLPFASAGPVASAASASGAPPAGTPTTAEGVEAPSGAAATVRIENPTGGSLNIHTIAPDRSAAPAVAEVDAGFAIELPIAPGTLLGFSDDSGWVGETYFVSDGAQSVTLPIAGAATADGQTVADGGSAAAGDGSGPPRIVPIGDGTALVRVGNPTGQDFSVHEILADASGAPEVARVGAGDSIEIPAQAGAMMGFSDGNDWVGGQYVVTADAGQAVRLPLEETSAAATITPIGNGSVTLDIDNRTDSALLVHNIVPDRSAAPVVAEIGAGGRLALPAESGELFGFSDEGNWIGAQYLVTAEARQPVALPIEEVAAGPTRIGDGSVTVSLRNTTAEDLAIHHLPEGSDQAPYVGRIGAGGSVDLAAEALRGLALPTIQAGSARPIPSPPMPANRLIFRWRPNYHP